LKKRVIFGSLAFLLSITLTGCHRKCSELERDRIINSQKDLFCLEECILPIPDALSLDDVILIALEQNYELLVKQVEFVAQTRRTMSEKLKMLPGLIVNGELSHRNNELIVSSESTVPNVPPAPPSISTDETVKRYDVSFVLDILDFGLAYYGGRQAENRAFVLEFEYQRIAHQLVLDVTKQYWKAIAAKRALDGARDLLVLSQQFQDRIDKQVDERIISPVVGLKSQSDLISLQLQFRGFNRDYHVAMSELALLMGLPPSLKFELVPEPISRERLCFDDIFTLEEIALLNRPELYAGDCEEKIAEDEVRSAFLRMIPGIELFTGGYYDANSFLKHHHWIVAGARATWNIFSLPSKAYDGRAAMVQKDVIKLKRIALSVGVLSQVRLSHIIYQDNYEQFILSDDLMNVNQDLVKAATGEYEGGIISAIELLDIRSKALMAELNYINIYGELQVSLEQLNNSIGLPRYYQNNFEKHEEDLCQQN
jgi:outer membrane protein TolC